MSPSTPQQRPSSDLESGRVNINDLTYQPDGDKKKAKENWTDLNKLISSDAIEVSNQDLVEAIDSMNEIAEKHKLEFHLPSHSITSKEHLQILVIQASEQLIEKYKLKGFLKKELRAMPTDNLMEDVKNISEVLMDVKKPEPKPEPKPKSGPEPLSQKSEIPEGLKEHVKPIENPKEKLGKITEILNGLFPENIHFVRPPFKDLMTALEGPLSKKNAHLCTLPRAEWGKLKDMPKDIPVVLTDNIRKSLEDDALITPEAADSIMKVLSGSEAPAPTSQPEPDHEPKPEPKPKPKPDTEPEGPTKIPAGLKETMTMVEDLDEKLESIGELLEGILTEKEIASIIKTLKAPLSKANAHLSTLPRDQWDKLKDIPKDIPVVLTENIKKKLLENQKIDTQTAENVVNILLEKEVVEKPKSEFEKTFGKDVRLFANKSEGIDLQNMGRNSGEFKNIVFTSAEKNPNGKRWYTFDFKGSKYEGEFNPKTKALMVSKEKAPEKSKSDFEKIFGENVKFIEAMRPGVDLSDMMDNLSEFKDIQLISQEKTIDGVALYSFDFRGGQYIVNFKPLSKTLDIFVDQTYEVPKPNDNNLSPAAQSLVDRFNQAPVSEYPDDNPDNVAQAVEAPNEFAELSMIDSVTFGTIAREGVDLKGIMKNPKGIKNIQLTYGGGEMQAFEFNFGKKTYEGVVDKSNGKLHVFQKEKFDGALFMRLILTDYGSIRGQLEDPYSPLGNAKKK